MENYISKKTKLLQEKLLESQRKDQALQKQIFEEIGKFEFQIAKLNEKKISPEDLLGNKKIQFKNLKAIKNQNNPDENSELKSNDSEEYSESEGQNQKQ